MKKNHYIVLTIIIINVIIFLYRFYLGRKYLQELNVNESIIYEENYISCSTRFNSEIHSEKVFRIAKIKVANNFIIIASNFIFAYYLKKRNLLNKIPFSSIKECSLSSNVISIIFSNDNHQLQEVKINVLNPKRVYELISSKIPKLPLATEHSSS